MLKTLQNPLVVAVIALVALALSAITLVMYLRQSGLLDSLELPEIFKPKAEEEKAVAGGVEDVFATYGLAA